MLISMRVNIMPRALFTFSTVSMFSFLFTFRIWSIFLSFSVGRASSSCFLRRLKSYSSTIFYLDWPVYISIIWITMLMAGFLSYIMKYFSYCSSRSSRVSAIFLNWAFIVLHRSQRNPNYCWFISEVLTVLVVNVGFDVWLLGPYT